MLACAGAWFRMLQHSAYDGPWYPIADVMSFSTAPPVGHRILFVLLARLVKILFPAATALRCFFASQIFALLLALHFTRKLASLFVPAGLAAMAPVILTAMTVTYPTYYNFYDLGILAFFSGGLFYILQGRLGAYLLLLTLGMLNHELIVLLIPVFAFVWFDGGPPPLRLAGQLLAQAALCFLVWEVLSWWLPSSAAPVLRTTTNLQFLRHPPPGDVKAYLVPLLWLGLAVFGTRHAPPRLSRCLILLPLLVMTTFVYGMFHELRQFYALQPVLVSLVLCLAAAHLDGGRSKRGVLDSPEPADVT